MVHTSSTRTQVGPAYTYRVVVARFNCCCWWQVVQIAVARETSLACRTIHPAMGRASQQPPQQPPLHQSALPAMPNYSASESQSPAPAVRVSVPTAPSHVTASRINSAPSSELQLPPDDLHCPPPPSQLPTTSADQSLPTHRLSFVHAAFTALALLLLPC